MTVPDPLVAARRLADAATPGPWMVRVEGGVSDGEGWHSVEVDFGSDNPCAGLMMGDDENDQADAEFIAWCREGVPGLLDQLEAAQRRANRAEARCGQAAEALGIIRGHSKTVRLIVDDAVQDVGLDWLFGAAVNDKVLGE